MRGGGGVISQMDLLYLFICLSILPDDWKPNLVAFSKGNCVNEKKKYHCVILPVVIFGLPGIHLHIFMSHLIYRAFQRYANRAKIKKEECDSLPVIFVLFILISGLISFIFEKKSLS